MATHEFGILPQAPAPGRRYDSYEPEKYRCISIDDEALAPLSCSPLLRSFPLAFDLAL